MVKQDQRRIREMGSLGAVHVNVHYEVGGDQGGENHWQDVDAAREGNGHKETHSDPGTVIMTKEENLVRAADAAVLQGAGAHQSPGS